MKTEKKKQLVNNSMRKAMKAEMLLELLVDVLQLEYDDNLTMADVMQELHKVRSEAERMAGNTLLVEDENQVETAP